MNDLRRIFRYATPYKKQALLALVFLLLMVFLDLSIPRLIQRIIDQGIRRMDLAVVLQTAGIMVLVSITSAVVAVLNNIYSIRVGEGVGRDLRAALFHKVQTFSYGNLDRFSTGRLMVRLTSDTAAVQRIVQVSLRIGTRGPLLMLGSIILMFVTSTTLALSMLPLLIVSGAIIVYFSLRMEPNFRQVQQRLDQLNTVLQENIAGARLVKAFTRAGHEAGRFEVANQGFTASTIRVMQFMSVMSPLLTMFVNAGIVLVIALGGLQAIRGNLTLGQIVAFTNYLLTTLNPLTMLVQLSYTWASGLASARRIHEVLDDPPEVQPPADPVEPPARADSRVTFENADFHYNSDTSIRVLEDICLEAKPGETVAILGATGAGKTTLVNLIPRFYDTTAGQVRVNGVNVRQVHPHALLQHISIVPQETVLFSGTVRENICYGRPDAPEEEVLAAARAAQAHDFILSLPQGYQTRVEERGANLSGGQRQRIAIARALLTRPRILILDDSTSAVDVETENRIQAALAARSDGRTTFVVAQRISTVLNADRIILLDRGRIVATGDHATLLKNSPIYQEIYESQLGAAPNNGNGRGTGGAA